MKQLFITLLLALLFHPITGKAIRLPLVIENQVFTNQIKTVEMHRTGNKLSNPVVLLNSDEQLTFTFDDFSETRGDFYYTIFHCDRNWKLSAMAQQEYLESFTEFPLNDYEFAVNTRVAYTNYLVQLPNDDVPLLFSGNYAMVVFDRNQPDTPLITWRFYVVEPRVSIEARIRRGTHDALHGENQEVDFRVIHGSFQIPDPVNELKVVVKQNNRDDNALTGLKPLFISNGILDYDYSTENIFKGGNEFRFFEIRSIKYPGDGVEALSYQPPLYHATLPLSQLRTQNRYFFYREMNGNFSIEAPNIQYPDIEADYFMVHFALAMDQPLLGGSVHVFGKLSNWQCNEQNKMRYNFDRSQYELSMLLKQGYYNYMYAYYDQISGRIKIENLEGSHYETENDYQIYVYHGRMTDRYDRLIGYKRFNSSIDRSY